MKSLIRYFEFVGRSIYCVIAVSLMVISVAMNLLAMWDVWNALHEKVKLAAALLDAIGLIVIAMAVFDVSKFLLEEEVLRDRELASPSEARETLTKFLVIISIAVCLEALVFIFNSAKTDITMLIYPTFLLIAAVLLVIGLGVYQKLSRQVEVTSHNIARARQLDKE